MAHAGRLRVRARGFLLAPFHQPFVVAPDGHGFIMLQNVGVAAGQDIYVILVQNWFEELKAKLKP